MLVHALEMSERPQSADGGAPARADDRRAARRRGAQPAGPVGAHRSLALRLRPALFARADQEPLRAGGLRGGDVDERAAHAAGVVAPAARRGARLRPDRARRVAGLRRRHRRRGGEADRAGRNGPGAASGLPRRSARRSGRPPARSARQAGTHRRVATQSRKIAWSARKFHKGRRIERFRTRSLP